MAPVMRLPSRSRSGVRMLCMVVAAFCFRELMSPSFTPRAMLDPMPEEEPLPEIVSPISGFTAAHARLTMGLVMVLCFAVCKTELAPTPPPHVTVLEKREDYHKVAIMSAHLSFMSGMVNALCILEMGMTVAHHTGNASHTGRLLGIDAWRFECAMIGFFIGAFVAGYNKVDGETLYAGRYSAGLMAAAIAVGAAAVLQWNSDQHWYTVPLFAYSQGIQNAVTRKHSALPICTTHFTGYLTDFGSLLGGYTRATVVGDHAGPSLRRPGFFGLSILTFAIGGYAAKVLRDHFGILAGLVPAVLMAVTAMGLVPLQTKGNKR